MQCLIEVGVREVGVGVGQVGVVDRWGEGGRGGGVLSDEGCEWVY